MSTVFTLGEPMAGMYPTEPVTLDAAKTLGLDVAGAESNFAIGLARLGVDVHLYTRLGADRFGDMIRGVWRREGVDAGAVMTDPDVGGTVVIGPLTVEHLARVIATHRPDALLPTLGGQTGLNLAVGLDDAGVLDRIDAALAQRGKRVGYARYRDLHDVLKP